MNTKILDLINNFSNEHLIHFFREKNTSFKVENQQQTSDNPDFTNGLLVGVFTTDNEMFGKNNIAVFSFESKKPLSERTGKKTQYEIAKNILKNNYQYSAGIFVFYDSKGDFRFSLVYDIVTDAAKRQWSNFRRFTYFVSKDQSNKTFIKQIGDGNFLTLEGIKEAFSVEPVTKEFYNEIQNWYFWALDKIKFPDDYKFSDNYEKDIEIRNATNLIRLITRIIFIWFLKEKKLIPDKIFDKNFLQDFIHDFNIDENSTNYYNAILQNLFFGTLNQKMNERKFVDEGNLNINRKEYGVKNLYRYTNKFKCDKKDVINLFADIPFLNGGLFDCLDKENENGKVVYIDGFSRNPAKQAIIPDYLFFQSNEKNINLQNFGLGDNRKVRGLIEILKGYNFTIDENTTNDQEIALDPELLGKVFENLLAAFNPETSTTARKATGSYYTPREIVDYMVKQSIKQYLLSHTQIDETTIELLLSDSEKEIELTDEQRKEIVTLIDNIKIFDPACGSGAFPMGILHQMVFILQKLDSDNKLWYEVQYNKALEETKQAFKHSDKNEREQLLKEINDSFDEKINYPDYARKLYLIENCIYGVDIQPIAIQISKLRFFISLVLDQKVDLSRENLGIRALPNLETKFVAANTLVQLEKPYSTYYTDEIKNIENEIKQLRHKYFDAKTRDEKIKYQQIDKELRTKLSESLKKLGFPQNVSEEIVKFDPYNQNQTASWFDAEWMFGLREGFDIVIGNPPYISTKGIDEKFKKVLEKQYDFADDTYNHFYFKGIEILKNGGVLAYISSKTFWTIQTKKNLRQLILKNKLLQLFDTANPFESAMVDTCVTLIQKTDTNKNDNYEFIYLNGKNSLSEPIQAQANIEVYKFAPNQVFFPITEYNLKIYHKYGRKVNELLNTWWDKISTSKNIDKYKQELEQYRQSLKPGDLTLLGLITEGGQGLATANNGKYVGVLEGTKWADNVRKKRPEKLLSASAFCKKEGIKTKADAETFLKSMSENEIRALFDSLKEKYGRDIFDQGWLFRIVSTDEVADVESLTEDEKLNGIIGKRTFVPYDKGDKDGNRWWAPAPYYIDWSRENVKFLKENSGKKGEGMPVVRNPQFYFREGFCWTDVNSTYLKSRLKQNGVYDVLTMSLFTSLYSLPDFYYVCIINSKFISEYVDDFVNSTSHFQINDARQLPIIIPTREHLNFFENIFNRAVAVQKEKFAGKISESEAEERLKPIQEELDRYVEEMYMGV